MKIKKKIKAKRKRHTCKLTGSPPSAPHPATVHISLLGIIALRQLSLYFLCEDLPFLSLSRLPPSWRQPQHEWRLGTVLGPTLSRACHRYSGQSVSIVMSMRHVPCGLIDVGNACDPQNYEPNLALNLEVTDLINSKKGNA